MAEKERKIGPEETLWKELLERAGMSAEDQAPLLALARGRDLDIGRIQRGQQKIYDAMIELTEAIRGMGRSKTKGGN